MTQNENNLFVLEIDHNEQERALRSLDGLNRELVDEFGNRAASDEMSIPIEYHYRPPPGQDFHSFVSLGLLAHPAPHGIFGVLVVFHASQQIAGAIGHANHAAVFGKDKAFLFGVVDGSHERLEISARIEQANRFFMDANLSPGNGLEQFVEGAKSAGQGNVALGQFVHAGLALVDGGGYFQPGEAKVRQGGGVHALDDDANHLAAGLQRAIGDGAHDAGLAPAKD